MRTFPVVLIMGSRQVGKTTLARDLLKNYKYVLLEDPDMRSLALADPKRFLESHTPPVIFDEFQNVPSLTSYLQGMVDENRHRKGQIVLTGSQNFLMMEQVNQSLAGRIGILTMYGLSSTELPASALNVDDECLGRLLLRGTYPELWSSPEIAERDWYGSYVQTYIERDVRKLANVGDLLIFERFVRVCAAHTGQVINLSSIASDTGVSVPTVQRWLSILEATYIIRLVQPFIGNLTSRIRKAPKMYFMDTGLAVYLMGFRDSQSVMGSPQYGALFETLVYSDFVKRTSAEGEIPEHYYLQTATKAGADLLVRTQKKLIAIEIKGGKTLTVDLADQLRATAKFLMEPVSGFFLLGPYAKSTDFRHGEIEVHARPWPTMTY